MKKLTLFSCVLIFFSTSIAAPLVQFWIQDDPFAKEFLLLCSVDQNDNLGLAAYSVTLLTNPTSYVDTAPMGRDGLTPIHGFTSMNDWQVPGPIIDELFSGQNPLQESTLISGIGQDIVNITNPNAPKYVGHPNPPTEVGVHLSNNSWGIVNQPATQHDHAIVLAHGAYESTHAPVIDFMGGNVFLDLTGEPGSIIAAEVESLPTTIAATPLCIVDFEDFSNFAAHWLDGPCNETNNWCEGADLNQLNDVDIVDLMILANEWLYVCPFPWWL